jgi:quercetin dioxygenase-like cupin family protein
MIRTLSAVLMLSLPLPALTQPAPPPMKLFTAGADIPALIAKAKAAQKSPTINSTQPLVTYGPYRVQLEYRTGLTPPTVHHGEAELVYVIQGNATLATGGTLVGGKPMRPGATTDSGTGIEGATPEKLAQGDYVMVPPDTAHQFQDVTGEFIIMSVHLPVAAK